MQYLFELGREPDISFAELTHVFSGSDASLERDGMHAAVVTSEGALNTKTLMQRLGGTIKIGEFAVDGQGPDAAAAFLHEAQPEGKVRFSISGKKKEFGKDVKRALKDMGRSARYIEIKNTASLIHNGLVERRGHLAYASSGAFATVAVQEIDTLSARDFGRPHADATSGMLPPKLARIMLNLAGVNEKTVLLDPFCGSGTVLMEAAVIGVKQLYGNDISEKAVHDSKKNIAWVQKEFAQDVSTVHIAKGDAQKIDITFAKTTFDAVVTEPFLGVPLRGHEPKSFLEKQTRELADLYVNTFVSLAKRLKKNSVVVIAIPAFRFQQDWVRIVCADRIAEQGFQVEPFQKEQEYLLYWRRKQRVGRELWKFRKT